MPNYQKNQLLRHDDRIIRVLTVGTDVLTIDCLKRTMPQWMLAEDLQDWEPCDETDLPSLNAPICDMENMMPEQRKVMHKRYTLIAPVLPFIHKDAQRSVMIAQVAELNSVSKQTIRKYLCLYLTYQRMEVLAPPAQQKERELTADEKNFRWALNKFYYTQRKHSLPTAYNLMLKERYTDGAGQLQPEYPPFHRFKYYYKRHRKAQTALISREGRSAYQRNSRPLLGTIQDFAPAVGTAMLDSTVLDIYLVNDAGQLVGRPILTLAVDAYSGLICGYHLSWEGGVYSLRQLMHNVVTDKVEWCRKFGITITPEEWPCSGALPGVVVTDRGREYTSIDFENLTTGFGVRIINVEAYRAEQKSRVEYAHRMIQDLFKPYLKGKGVIMEDFQERGGHDYRKDARLRLDDMFEKIILRCVLFCNQYHLLSEKVLSKEMLAAGVQPTANSLWKWSCAQPGANLIPVDEEQLRLTMLPRTEGKFTRRGLVVHKQRYRHCKGKFTERYLNGGKATVAYDPDDISCVYLVENGLYTRFELILKVYDNLSLDEVMELQARQQAAKKSAQSQKDQALIDLVASIETIANTRGHSGDVNLKGIRQTHKTEKQRRRSKQ